MSSNRRGAAAERSATKKAQSKKKRARSPGRKSSERKGNFVKGIILLAVAAVALAVMVYSGGTIRGFFAFIIALVCGLYGALCLWESRKR